MTSHTNKMMGKTNYSSAVRMEKNSQFSGGSYFLIVTHFKMNLNVIQIKVQSNGLQIEEKKKYR